MTSSTPMPHKFACVRKRNRYSTLEQCTHTTCNVNCTSTPTHMSPDVATASMTTYSIHGYHKVTTVSIHPKSSRDLPVLKAKTQTVSAHHARTQTLLCFERMTPKHYHHQSVQKARRGQPEFSREARRVQHCTSCSTLATAYTQIVNSTGTEHHTKG